MKGGDAIEVPLVVKVRFVRDRSFVRPHITDRSNSIITRSFCKMKTKLLALFMLSPVIVTIFLMAING